MYYVRHQYVKKLMKRSNSLSDGLQPAKLPSTEGQCHPVRETMRKAEIARKTSETDIAVSLDLDGNGISAISTGIPFFDHMLHHVTKHGLFDMDIKAVGDLQVDFHHTVEDIGICIGEAFRKALGDKNAKQDQAP